MNNETIDQSANSINLRDYYRILLKRKWILVTVFLSLVTASAIYSFTAIPNYQATAQVLIEKTTPLS